jgi:hypothetical protein
MAEENINDRKFASELLRLVRLGHLSVREAMLRYPKDTEDDSLIAAYHALIHYEADEDMRYKDIEYRDEQNDYLEFLAQTLVDGKELPRNIVADYEEYYKGIAKPWVNGLKGFFKEFTRFINT